MHFPKSWSFSFKPTTSIHYLSQRVEINCVDIRKDFTTTCWWNIKKKKIVIIIYIVYILFSFFDKVLKIFFKNK